jgi:hypothetical protein
VVAAVPVPAFADGLSRLATLTGRPWRVAYAAATPGPTPAMALPESRVTLQRRPAAATAAMTAAAAA